MLIWPSTIFTDNGKIEMLLEIGHNVISIEYMARIFEHTYINAESVANNENRKCNKL